MTDNRSLALASVLALGLVIAAACQGQPTPAPADLDTDPAASTTEPLRPVTIGLPYRPDIQFTPMYVARAKGYFAEAGLDVELVYGDESSFVRLVAAGEMEGLIASGDQVILARAQGLPVRYVMTWFRRFPVTVFAVDPDIQTPADLAGRTVGLPAPSGASYIGWQALLAGAGVDPQAVDTEVIGFTQAEAVARGRVDAAVGYAVNEPLQLRLDGHDVVSLEVADWLDIVSNGLVVGEGHIAEAPELVQGLVTATLKGIRDTLSDPEAAFEIALDVVPEAGDPEVRAVQRQVLEESLRFWEGDDLGTIDAGAWSDTQDLLVEIGLVEEPTEVAAMIDSRFVDAAGVAR